MNEKIDIWSLGNNMYALLTGLNPIYWTNTDGVKVRCSPCLLPNQYSLQSDLVSAFSSLQKAVKRREISYIDPRYLIRSKEEKALAGLIERCFKYDPDDRPTIFEVVSYLRNAVSESLGEEESRVDILQALGSEE